MSAGTYPPNPAQNSRNALSSSAVATPATMCPARLLATALCSSGTSSFLITSLMIEAKVFPL